MGVRTESTAPTPQLSSYRRRLMVGPSPTNGRCGGVDTSSKVNWLTSTWDHLSSVTSDQV